MEILLSVLPSAGTIAGVVLVLFLAQRILGRRAAAASGARFRHQLLMLVLTAVGALLVLLVIPISEAMRGQLLGLIGILLSAAVALSSTTFLGNAMAGVMLRAVRNFRMGDFIRTGEHFGRVSERGLFHTEIQTEGRDLTTLPNLYLVTNPVTTVRASGTIVSTHVSLGYDVPRGEVKQLLLEAARGAELSDPFVQVRKLGDFSATYRVSGLLTDVKNLLTVRARLRGLVMDTLHAGGVEIVSPTFMNTRALKEDQRFISRPARPSAGESDAAPEAMVFDKADQAESLEALRRDHAKLCEEIEGLEEQAKKAEEDSEKQRCEARLGSLRSRKERLEGIIEDREAGSDKES